MTTQRNYWLNVDFPTGSCVLHKTGCVYETEKRETPLKGMGEYKRDGGWISFESVATAEAEYRRDLARRGLDPLQLCALCFPG